MFYVNVIDAKDGSFELIDGDLLYLYPDLAQDNLIALSNEMYQTFCAQDNGNTKWIDGKFVFEKTAVDLTALLEQRRKSIITQLANKTDRLKSEMLEGYPQTEIDSFYRQEKEALAYKQNPQAETPMLRQIAENRGVPFEVLVEKVIEKASQFAYAVGALIGVRQAFEDRTLAATTEQELEQIEREVNEWH